MKRNFFKCVLLCLLILGLLTTRAQDSTAVATEAPKVFRVEMYDGAEYRGEIVTESAEVIVLKTNNGELKLIRSNIKSITEDTYHGKFRFDNPHSTRYFFGPSGIPIAKGSGYYQNLMLSTNFANFSAGENFSIGGGVELISLLFGEPIWFFTPKVGVPINEKNHIGAGLFVVGVSDFGTATLAYGVYTLGSHETNATVGVGYGYFDGEWGDRPTFSLAGTHRLSNGVALLSENYLISSVDNSIYVGIQGVRLMSRKNAFDIGLIISSEFDASFPAFPFVGYARAF